MKKYYFMTSAAALLLTGAVVFNACKKDKDEDPKGVEIAKAVCDCSKKTDGVARLTCLVSLLEKYGDLMDMDMETGSFVAKDKTIQADFSKYIVENCPAGLED